MKLFLFFTIIFNLISYYNADKNEKNTEASFLKKSKKMEKLNNKAVSIKSTVQIQTKVEEKNLNQKIEEENYELEKANAMAEFIF
jgi:hypothetical protein